MGTELKYQSTIPYGKGTILHDETTKQNFEVLRCDRIRLFNDAPQWGLTVREVK